MNAVAERGSGGVYPVAEAARLAHMRPLTVRRWIEGYDYQHKGVRRRSEGVPYLASSHATGPDALELTRRSPVLDFEQLLTLLLVHAFHQRGLSLPKIKQAAARAQNRYNVENPFITKHFRSDGNKIFLDLAQDTHGKDRHLVDVLSDQREFRDVVEPSLFQDTVFAGNRLGEWRPLGLKRSVSVSPLRQFGAPHIASTGVRTDVIAEMVAAEGGGQIARTAAADWFGLSADQVADAVEFEDRWLRAPR